MLKFLSKIAAQHILSLLGNERLYHKLQDMSGSRQPTFGMVKQKVEIAELYLRKLESLGASEPSKHSKIVEIGAGWHLTIPLFFSQCGYNNQQLFDIRKHAEEEVIYHVADFLKLINSPRTRRALPVPEQGKLDSFLLKAGIQYTAPFTGPLPIEDETVSLVTATQILLHPPANVVKEIFKDVARILRPGGYFIATIHLYDLYNDFDKKISRFNFLRYTNDTWQRYFNCAHMQYNRLRASDYKNIFEGLPFEVAEWEPTLPDEKALSELDRIPLAEEFKKYSREDLASSHLLFVMRKK